MILNRDQFKEKVIAEIPEASGICFIEKNKSFIVVNDEGWIYEISKKGKIIRKELFDKNYDLEGVDYNSKTNELYIAVEGRESILILDYETLKKVKEVKIKRVFKDVAILKKSKGNGLEAIAIDEKGNIYVSNQSKVTYKGDDMQEAASVIVRIDGLDSKKARIVEVYNHGYIDIAGMTFHDGYLYMTSDKKNLLIKYDLKHRRTIAEIKLPKSAQEGVCIDDKGNIFIADDNGRVLRYKKKKKKLNIN